MKLREIGNADKSRVVSDLCEAARIAREWSSAPQSAVFCAVCRNIAASGVKPPG
jgi:hypothetical protein